MTSLLRHCRLHGEGAFDEKALPAVIKLATDIEKRSPALDHFLFKFEEKADVLYKLVMPRLPPGLATEFRQTGGESNGFELFRQLTQKLEPARSENAFHLANEIRGLGGVGSRKNFEQTVRFVKFLNSRMKEILFETGQVFPEDDTQLKLSSYEPVQEWILQKDNKSKARRAVRHKAG